MDEENPLDEMVRLSQEMGGYDANNTDNPLRKCGDMPKEVWLESDGCREGQHAVYGWDGRFGNGVPYIRRPDVSKEEAQEALEVFSGSFLEEKHAETIRKALEALS